MEMLRSASLLQRMKLINNDMVTVEEFVSMIGEQLKAVHGVSVNFEKASDLSDYGRMNGWLEDNDILHWKSSIERKSAARIVHEVLRKEQKEPDEDYWQDARELKDLYDCHTCVNHVAQVYAKGIMEPVNGRNLFGMRQHLTCSEAEIIVTRMFEYQKRKPPKAKVMVTRSAVMLSLQETLAYLTKNKQAMLIDVRTAEEYEKRHLTGAIHVSMTDVLKNPYRITQDYDIPMLFYCQQGYQSEIAANCVIEAGYKEVFYLKWELKQ